MRVFSSKQSTRELRQVDRNTSRNTWLCWYWWRWGSLLMGAIVVGIFMTEWVWGRSKLDFNKFNQMKFGNDAKPADIVQLSSFIPPLSDLAVPRASLIIKNATSLSSQVQGEVKTKPRTTTTTISGIIQKHVVDCHSIVRDTVNENVDPGGGLFVKTKTEPSFWMNIHQPSNDIVSSMIQRDGCFECEYIKDIQNVLQSHPTAYFLDIGTNIGMWTLSIAAMGYDTYSLEPFPQNSNRVCRSIKRNPELFQNHVTLLNVAATMNVTKMTLVIPEKENMGSIKFSPIDMDSNNHSKNNTDGGALGSNEYMSGIPIDSLRLPLNRPVAIKLDVEGGELDAMMGMLDYLENAEIVLFHMELRTLQLKRNREKVKSIATILSKKKRLIPYRRDYDAMQNCSVEMELSPESMAQSWKSQKHPHIRYFDVVWRLPNNASTPVQ